MATQGPDVALIQVSGIGFLWPTLQRVGLKMQLPKK